MATTHQTNGLKSNPILNELAIADLMTVMKELIAVVQSENDLLHRGLPAALSDCAEQKDQLTSRFTDLSRGVLSSCTQELSDDDDLREQIVTTGQALKSLTQENMRLLRGAMDATRRRVNSVMSAIQAEGTKQGSTYGASGTITAANFIDRQGGYKA
jgi:flagellar biosynthesis/type III secretory pathway chaperone